MLLFVLSVMCVDIDTVIIQSTDVPVSIQIVFASVKVIWAYIIGIMF